MSRTFIRSVSCFALMAGLAGGAAQAQLPPATFPGENWEAKTPAELGMDATKLEQAKTYAADGTTFFGAGLITRNGYQVYSWGKLTDRYPISSASKGIGAILLGVANTKPELAIKLDDKAASLYPDFGRPPAGNDAERLAQITIEQLATHTAGFEKDGDDPDLEQTPGSSFQYSDGGANWLADILTYKMNEDLRAVLKREVLDHLGIQLVTGDNQVGDITWRNVDANARGTTIGSIPRREFNSGISANVDALARFGLLLERKGNWNGTQILAPQFVEALAVPRPSIAGLPVVDGNGRPDARYPNAPAHHGLFWWNNGDGTMQKVPRDAFWAWGHGDHLIVVIPSLQLVVARTSAKADQGEDRLKASPWKAVTDPDNCAQSMCAHYDALEPFLTPIVESITAIAAPAITFSSSAASVTAGGTITLSWSVTGANSCTASNGWSGSKATSGSETVTVNQSATYVLDCTGAGGTTQKSVAVTATPAGGGGGGGGGGGDSGGGGGGAVQWWMLAGLLLSALRGFTLGASRRERLVN